MSTKLTELNAMNKISKNGVVHFSKKKSKLVLFPNKIEETKHG